MKTPLRDLQRNWEGLAQSDPLWAICTDPARRNNQWTHEEFFASGKEEVDRVLKYLKELNLQLDPCSPALDFGCGIGRLTRSMAQHFTECWGVDISPTMIRMAEGLNEGIQQCRFMLNENEQLDFPDSYFGFIYSSIVLQHIPSKFGRTYLLEMIRVLKPGGVLVFQIPDRFKAGVVARLRRRFRLRTRLRKLLVRTERSYVMEMNCLAEARVRKVIAATGATLMDVKLTNSAEPAFGGNLIYLDREPAEGFVSKQYCVVKLL